MVLSLSVLSKSIERLTDRERKLTTSHTLKNTDEGLQNDFKEFFQEVVSGNDPSCVQGSQPVTLTTGESLTCVNCSKSCEEYLCSDGFFKTYIYDCATTPQPPNLPECKEIVKN